MITGYDMPPMANLEMLMQSEILQTAIVRDILMSIQRSIYARMVARSECTLEYAEQMLKKAEKELQVIVNGSMVSVCAGAVTGLFEIVFEDNRLLLVRLS